MSPRKSLAASDDAFFLRTAPPRGSMGSTGGELSSQATAAGRRTSATHTQARRRSTMPSSGGSLSDNINLGVLKHLEGVFNEADKDSSGLLDMVEFAKAFTGVINTPEGSDDEALRKLFMLIDANCDGRIDWNEFSQYLLLEKTTSTGAAAVPGAAAAVSGVADLAFGTLEPSAAAQAAAHKELVSGVMHVDNGVGPDKWYSTGRDGTVKVWNGKDLSHLRTFQVPLPSITCSTYLPQSNLLALGSYTSSVLLIDPASGEQAGKVTGAAISAAMSLTAWQEGGDVLTSGGEGRELMVVGDTDGGVNLVQVTLDDLADKKSKTRYQGRHLWRAANHHDWVCSVLYMPQLNSILAASLDKKLTMTDTERCIAVKTLQGHDKSVTCCGWSGMYKMAISGSEDKTVILWNPFSCRPLGTLSGHTAGIIAMALNEKDHQVLTAASDKTIKVWDLRNQRCIQTLVDPASYYPDDTSSALTYSPARKLLVSAAYSLRGWPLTDTQKAGGVGHRDPVSWVGYNQMFSEAVSADHSGKVCVWHVMSGRLRFAFANTHGGSRISAAAFDANHGRLITGAQDGSVKVWNFSSGTLLSSLAVPDYSHDWGSGSGAEVTGLAVSSSNQAGNIIVTGWDRKVTWYDDSGRRVSKLLRSSSGPASDVLAAALMEGYPTLATACYDGEIWLWNLESGAVRRKLVIPGHATKPENEQAVEKLAFMHGDLRHVLVSVGADRVMRFWDCFTGACLAEQFTGHQQGESVAALALSPDNTTAVTADTAGYIMVWNISNLKLPSVSKSQARPSSAAAGLALSLQKASGSGASGVEKVAVWRGHLDAVTALDWIPAPTAAAAQAAVESARLTAEAVASAEASSIAQSLSPPATARSRRAKSPETVQEPVSTAAAAGTDGRKLQAGLASKHQRQQQQQQMQQMSDSCESAPTVGSLQQQATLKRQDGGNGLQQQQQQSLQQPRTSSMASQQQQQNSGFAAGYIVSASLDKTLVLWSGCGALVGVFGRHSWSLDNINTWQSQTRARLKAGEAFDMLVSARAVELKQCTFQDPSSPQQQQQWQQPASPQDRPVSPGVGSLQAGSSNTRRPSRIGDTSPSAANGARPSSAAAAAAGFAMTSQSSSNGRNSRSPSRPASACRPASSRPASAASRVEQLLQQQQQRSRPSSQVGFLAEPGSGQTSRPRTPTSGVQSAAGELAGATAGDNRTNAGSVALVCQISMKQRANVLKTLGSIKQQHSPQGGGDDDYVDDVSGSPKSQELAELLGSDGSVELIEQYDDSSTDDDEYILAEQVSDQIGTVAHDDLAPAAEQQQQQVQLDPQQQQLQQARAAIVAARLQQQQSRARPASAGPVLSHSTSSRTGFLVSGHASSPSSCYSTPRMTARVSSALPAFRVVQQAAAGELQQVQMQAPSAVQPGTHVGPKHPAASHLLQVLQQRPASSMAKQRPSSAAVGGRLRPQTDTVSAVQGRTLAGNVANAVSESRSDGVTAPQCTSCNGGTPATAAVNFASR